MKYFASGLLAAFLGLGAFARPCLAADASLLRIGIFEQTTLGSAHVYARDADLRIGNEVHIGTMVVTALARGVRLSGDPKGTVRSSVIFFSSGTLVVDCGRAGARSYVGSIEARSKRGHLRIVNVTPLEPYVAAVLAVEAPEMKEPEAQKAMEVVIRSYALAERARHRKDGFELCDLPHCQLFKGLAPAQGREPLSPSIVLTYEGRVIHAYYHACCGGRTESSGAAWEEKPSPYLVSVSDEDPHDGHVFCDGTLGYRWSRRISVAKLESVFVASGWMKTGDHLQSLTVGRRSPTGRATRLVVRTDRKSMAITGSLFHRRVGRKLGWSSIRSWWFDIRRCDTKQSRAFCFEGRGYGHGVGMCQAGAEGMAKSGYGYEQIVYHYFPTTTLMRSPAEDAGPSAVK